MWWILGRRRRLFKTTIYEWTEKKQDVDKAVKNIIQIFKFLCPEEDFPEQKMGHGKVRIF